MPENLGVAFVIGATVAASVNTAFNIVSNKIKQTQADLGKARREVSVLSKAIALSRQKESLEQKAAAGGGNSVRLQAELARVTERYDQARKAALAYGDSVDAWEKAQLKAQASLRALTTQKALQTGLQQESNRRRESRSSMIGDVARVMAVAAPVRSAIAFESAMADAAKTIDGMRDSAGNLTPAYYEMEAAVKRLGRVLPLTHEQIASLFAAGGQQGLSAPKELEEFATLAAQMAVAFGMSNEEAADAIGGYRTALGLSFEDTRSMLDLMNQYANTSSASERGIADIVRRVGSLGAVAGVSSKPMTALAATLDSMKIAPEVAATGIKNLLLTLTSGSAATKTQREAFARLGIDAVKLSKQMQKDGPAAVISVLEAVQKLPEAEQLSLMSQLFGKESIGAIAPLLKNLQLVRKNLVIAGDGAQYAGAMQQEFENRSRTTANNLVILKNRASEMAITLGATVLPALNSLLAGIGPVISAVADFAQEHQGLTFALVSMASGLAIGIPALRGLVYLFSLGRTVVLGCRTAILMVSTSQKTLAVASYASAAASRVSAVAMGGLRGAAALGAAGMRVLAVGIRAAGLAMRATPIGLLVSGMALLYSACEPVRAAFDAAFSWISNLVGKVWEKIKGVGSVLKSIGSWAGFGGDDTEEAQAAAPLQAVAADGGQNSASLPKIPPLQAVAAPFPAAAAMPADSAPEGSAPGFDWTRLTAGGGGQNSASLPKIPPLQAVAAPFPAAATVPADSAPEGSAPGFDWTRLTAGGGQNSGQNSASLPNGTSTGGASVTAQFSFQMNGMPDRDFGERVVQALSDRRAEFENLIDRIVRDQQRVAYGS